MNKQSMNDFLTDSQPAPSAASPPIAAALLTFQEFEGMVLDGCFYVRDTALGEKLGYDRPRKIRDLINRHVDELAEYDTAPQVGAQYTKRIVAQDETAAYYLNEDQALILIGHSDAPNAKAIKRLMMAVIQSFVRGGQELTLEQALDRVAYCDSALCMTKGGANLQFRRADVLRTEADPSVRGALQARKISGNHAVL